jgi:hypothetical protein
VIWTPYGGDHGTIMVSGMGINVSGVVKGNGYMINQSSGEGEWTFLEAPIAYQTNGIPGGYSQTMIPIDSTGRQILQLVPVPNGDKQHMDIKYAKFDLPK